MVHGEKIGQTATGQLCQDPQRVQFALCFEVRGTEPNPKSTWIEAKHPLRAGQAAWRTALIPKVQSLAGRIAQTDDVLVMG